MPRGYESYRGRRSAIIRLLIVVLVVVLISACTFLFIQRFVTYTDDGKMRIDLPFMQGEPPKEPPAAPENEGQTGGGSSEAGTEVNLVIDSSGQDETDPANPGADPDPAPPQDLTRHLIQIDALPADPSALSETLAASGANGFVWRARENTGVNRFASDASLKDALPADAVSAETLTALCGAEGVTSVALFNCFHDSYYAYVHMAEAAICQSNGYVWYDNHNYHWLDASKEQARTYVQGLAVECAKLGFDELLLEDMAYPAAGNLYKISYTNNTMGKTDALALFLTELRAALEPYGVRLSLLVPGALLNAGSNADSGQDLAALAPLVDTIYADVSDAAAAQAVVDEAVGTSGQVDFVPLTSAPVDGEWCILS
ncbi:MAG: putative glycoside hydrolase [Oscillospiraceae bacterium]|nr:putative glycoside hydrolase [Oscillospiraceae bacterium]